MEGLLIVIAILVAIDLGIVFFLGGLSKKHASFFLLGGGILYAILQTLILSFGRGIHLHLILFDVQLQIIDFVRSTHAYFDDERFRIFNVSFFSVVFAYLLPAFLEECGKFWVLKLVDKKLKLIRNVATALICGTYAAAGFAFFETVGYVISMRIDSTLTIKDILQVGILRSILSTASHILFSSVIAYFYAKALFLKFEIVDNLEISKSTRMIKRFRRIPFLNIRTISKYYYVKYMLTGFGLSVFMHAVYNAFWDQDRFISATVTVVVGVAVFLKIILVKRHSKNYMELKNKIQKLKEMKELKLKVEACKNRAI